MHLKALNRLFDTFNVKKTNYPNSWPVIRRLSFFPTLAGIFTRLLFVGDVTMSVTRTAIVDLFQFHEFIFPIFNCPSPYSGGRKYPTSL